MSLDDAFERCHGSLHGAALDDARRPAASAATDEACGTGGNPLTGGEGTADGDRIHFARYLSRRESRQDLAREYFEVHYPNDAGMRRRRAGRRHEFFPLLPQVGDAQSVAAPYARARGMPPAHERSADRHYPCGCGFANKEERRRRNAVRRGRQSGGGLRGRIKASNSRHCKIQLAPGGRVPT